MARTAEEWNALYGQLLADGDTASAARLRQGLIEQGILAPESAPAAPAVVGAPFALRSIVDNARSPEDRLATLQQRYPDAQMTPDGNMAYTDESGQTVLYNRPGMDWGDLAGMTRALPEAAGALIGGTLGAAAGPVGLFGGAATGGAIAGQLYDQGLQRYGGVQDTRGIGSRLLDAGTDLAANALGAPSQGAAVVARTGQEVADRIGRSAPLGPAGDLLDTRMAQYETGRLADRAKVPLSAAQRLNNPEGWTGRLENILEVTPGGGGVIHKQRELAAERLKEFAEQAAPDATGSPTAAGEMIAESIAKRTGQKRRVEDALWTRAERLLDFSQGVDTPGLRQLLADVQSARASGGLLVDATRDRNLQTLEQALLKVVPDVPDASFESLKGYRTRIGEQIKSPLLQRQGSGQGNLKRIYAAASDDMAAAAEELGGPEAQRAWKRANDYSRALANDMGQVDKLVKGTPAEVFRRFEKAVKTDPSKAKAIIEAAEPAARERIMGEIVKRLGQARPGVQDASAEAFSPATFATNWARLNQEAPETLALFTVEQRRALDTISKLSSQLKAATAGRNTSRTSATAATGIGGLGGFGAGGLAGAGTGALAVAGGALASWLAAKALTSQSLAKAIGNLKADALTLPLGDFLKALGAAGASNADINAIRDAGIDAQVGMPASRPPKPVTSGLGAPAKSALL